MPTAKSFLKPRKAPPPAEQDDGMEIPAFLRLTAEQRAAAWANYTSRPRSLVSPPDKVQEQDKAREIAAEVAETKLRRRRATQLREGRIARDKQRLDIERRRKLGVGQADFSRIRRECTALGPRYVVELEKLLSFDPASGRWLRAEDRAVLTAPRKPNGTASAPKRLANVGDDTATRLLGYNREELLALAKANGVFEERYQSLPNPGLVRMTVGNRIRARAKRGVQINWV